MKPETIDTAEPLAREIAHADPVAVARRLIGREHLLFLDSAMRHERLGRYSYVMCDPVASIVARDGDRWESVAKPLTQALASLRLRHLPGLPPFQGGLAGYLAYEAGRMIEPQLIGRTPEPAIAPVMLHAYDVVVAFDHGTERAFVVSTGYPETEEKPRLKRAAARLEEFDGLLGRPEKRGAGTTRIASWRPSAGKAEHEAAVARTVEYILAGDIFQANIARAFTADVPEEFDTFGFYEELRRRNPATFAAFLQSGDLTVCSSSPERLVSFDGTLAEARPIKGTRRRHADANEDAALKQELLASRKDRAENTMIVDLLRNDLSRVCDPGTVDVPVLCGLESYASVHHLVSAVTGRLSAGRSPADLLEAVYPGGSISGAPKIRAIEVIGALEGRPRDIYCGSIGFIGHTRRMDFNICIRTVQFRSGEAVFQAGGGITARSIPSEEYDETLAKAQRIFEAFGAEPPR